MNKRKIFNTIFFAVAVYALYLRLPSILTHFQFQNAKASDFTVKTLGQENFVLRDQTKNTIVVFWATWCGPCEVELKRINRLIINKEILPTDVLAISSGEDEALVRNTVKKENYLFNVGIDADQSVAKMYKVSATPTIVFIDRDQKINWMTSGLSPTLSFRITSFLK